MAAISRPQREKAATFGDPYAAKKDATDAVALAYSDAVDKKDKIKSQLSTATDPAEIQRLQAESAKIEAEIVELKIRFDEAIKEEMYALYEMIETKKIPLNKDPAEFMNNPGYNKASPSFLNDASSIVLGWLGDAKTSTVNGKMIFDLITVLPLTPPDMTKVEAGRATRAAGAMEHSILLEELRADVLNERKSIDDQLNAARRGGANPMSLAAFEDKLATQDGILAKINTSMATGALTVLKTTACKMTGRNIGGVLSPFPAALFGGGAGTNSFDGVGGSGPAGGFAPGAGGGGGGAGIMKARAVLGDMAAGGGGGGGGGAKPFGIDSALGDGVYGSGEGGDGGTPVWWDAGGPAPGIQSGVFDDIIVEHVEPKLKHAYMALFEGKMAVLKWLVKTIDRPKIDVEYLEQMRHNVKRNYPIKYNYGDLSITFWDDINHKTVTTIDDYFHNNVWDHKAVPNRGEFLMRDSVVIPKFDILDYVMESHSVLKYTFYNASLASFDFDGHDDLEDGGVHTIQVVLKIEGYSVAIM